MDLNSCNIEYPINMASSTCATVLPLCPTVLKLAVAIN